MCPPETRREQLKPTGVQVSASPPVPSTGRREWGVQVFGSEPGSVHGTYNSRHGTQQCPLGLWSGAATGLHNVLVHISKRNCLGPSTAGWA